MKPEDIVVSLEWAKKLKEANTMPIIEEWNWINGFIELYRVSNLGRVERMYKNGGSRFLKPFWRGGYLCFSLSKANKKYFHPISRLVALNWIPNPKNKPQVNHINGDKSKNWISNLEWVTESENTQHAVDTGLRKRVQGVALQSQNGRPPWNKGKKTGQIPWNKSHFPQAA